MISDLSEPLQSGPVPTASPRAGWHRIASVSQEVRIMNWYTDIWRGFRSLDAETQARRCHLRAKMKCLDPPNKPFARFLIHYRPTGNAAFSTTYRCPYFPDARGIISSEDYATISRRHYNTSPE